MGTGFDSRHGDGVNDLLRGNLSVGMVLDFGFCRYDRLFFFCHRDEFDTRGTVLVIRVQFCLLEEQ
jgi:hypothetical protein